MIELRDIRKFFPANGVLALENAGLTLRPGELHALLGENGSGKSTLMHILAGYFPASSGTIMVDGKACSFSAPADALAHGIGMVRQHPGFVRGLKVWEDCILGAERQELSGANERRKGSGAISVFAKKCRSLFFDPGLARKRAMEASAKWGIDLPLDSQAETLTVGQRQKAAVLALLLRNVKWFIFDEPTAVLGAEESESLFRLFGRLRAEKRGIIFITHKLNEALAVSDRVTVMRQGVTGETLDAGRLSIESLTEQMSNMGQVSQIGHTLQTGQMFQTRQVSSKTPAFAIRNLRVQPPGLPFLREINLELMPGEILGILGDRDSGLETLEKTITGFYGEPAGSITLNGREIAGRGVRAFREAGGAYLGADRLGGNLAPDLPLSESLIIHEFHRARRGSGPFLDMERLKAWQKKIMGMAGIGRPVSGMANSFSGGMIQRILLAREFAESASLIVLAEATSGLDLQKSRILADEIRELADKGAAVLLLSTDKDELQSITDKIAALRDGILYAGVY